MGFMGMGYQKWISHQKSRKPFSRNRKPIHSDIANSSSGSRSFIPGKHSEEKQKTSVALKLTLWILGSLAVLTLFFLVWNRRMDNKANSKNQLPSTEIKTEESPMTDEYLLKNIETNFIRGQYSLAKSDLELFLPNNPNNKKARKIQLEIAYIEASKSYDARKNARALTNEFNLRYPLDTVTIRQLSREHGHL